MAIFDRFKKKQRVVLPEEVNEYYQSQRRERVSVAIILGVVALAVTLLIAAGLFFGGRFAYRKIANTDKPKPTAVQTDNKQPEENKQGATNGSGAVNAPTNPPSSTPQNTPPTNNNSRTTPPLGDNTTLPHTGDEGM